MSYHLRKFQIIKYLKTLSFLQKILLFCQRSWPSNNFKTREYGDLRILNLLVEARPHRTYYIKNNSKSTTVRENAFRSLPAPTLTAFSALRMLPAFTHITIAIQRRRLHTKSNFNTKFLTSPWVRSDSCSCHDFRI